MSIIVDHTLPFTPSALKLDDARRWSKLLPLMRPSLSMNIQSSEPILIDTSLRDSQNVQIAAIGQLGYFSSTVLHSNSIAAIASDTFGSQHLSPADVLEALKAKEFACPNGLVVVRAGSRQDLKVDEGLGIAVVEVEIISELKVDHVLSLLLSCNAETRSSWSRTTDMLKHFLKHGARTSSFFHENKLGESPSVIHAVEVAGFDSAKKAIERDLSHLLSSRPSSASGGNVVYSIHFADLNGLARLEKDILAHEISLYITAQNQPAYITQSSIVSSHTTARGWSISLCPVPITYLSPQATPKPAIPSTSPVSTRKPSSTPSTAPTFSTDSVRARIFAGCEAVIASESTITEYDTIVGDGDCGYTLRDGAKKVLSFVSGRDLSQLGSVLGELVDELEVSMGGTSGALYCIFLSGLAQALGNGGPSGGEGAEIVFAHALKEAKETLCRFTTARVGDRTMMDCLIPFVDTWVASADLREAVAEAEKGVEGTEKMDAKLGRSSYLDDSTTRGVPDPGAYGLLVLLKGMVGVW